MANQYPLPVYHFQVSWTENSDNVAFSEVSGLVVETQVIEYREGSNKEYLTYKMPGIKKYTNITLRRGTMATDNGFYEWWKTANLNTVTRRDVIISLLNEEHKPVVTWKVVNAFPVKVDFGGLKANGNEVLIESIELAHEGLTVERSK